MNQPLDIDGDNSSSSSGEENEEEQIQLNTSFHCLFCSVVFDDYSVIFEHFKLEHNFDLKDFVLQHKLDSFGFIKFINWTRKQDDPRHAVDNLFSFDDVGDEFMCPSIEDDGLLMFDVEQWESVESGPQISVNGASKQEGTQGNDSKQLIASLQDRILTMKQRMQEMCSEQLTDSVKPSTIATFLDDPDYFGSYSTYSIHEDMLKDKARTQAYESFFKRNNSVIDGKHVLDVGCGTGILSMFAAKAGAAKVTAVDNSDVAYMAMQIVHENDLSNCIEVVKSTVEHLKLGKTVDIIVSEWMGYFLLFEAMLDTVIFARDHFLKPNGIIAPSVFNILLSATDDNGLYKEHVGYWSDVYGFKMSCIRDAIIQDAQILKVDQSTLISEPVVLKTFNLYKMFISETQFTAKVVLKVSKPTLMTGLVSWFDCHFTLPESMKKPNDYSQITLSTSASEPVTHWKQTVFLFPQPVAVEVNSYEVVVSVSRLEGDSRSLGVNINFNGGTYAYRISR